MLQAYSAVLWSALGGVVRGRREESKIIFLIMHSRVKILRDRA